MHLGRMHRMQYTKSTISLLKWQQKPNSHHFAYKRIVHCCPEDSKIVFLLYPFIIEIQVIIFRYQNILYHFQLLTSVKTTTNQPFISDHQVNTPISDVILQTNEKLRNNKNKKILFNITVYVFLIPFYLLVLFFYLSFSLFWDFEHINISSNWSRSVCTNCWMNEWMESVWFLFGGWFF